MNRESIIALGCGTYIDAKQLTDGSWAVLAKLIYTWSIMIGVTEHIAFETRYCFDDAGLCRLEFDKLISKADVPVGWIAKRPQES